MLNSIRLKISNFIKKNETKIRDLGTKLIIVAIVVLIATIMLSSFSNDNDVTKKEETKNSYKPTDTVIKGSDISEEQFEQDKNTINKFLDLCNSKEIELAYNLLSDECKKELYPSIQTFENDYYKNIFDKKRECNLQAWISTSAYTVYRVRYTNNMLETGIYDSNNVYQDYITLNKKSNTEKISIGNFIDSEQCNIITKTNELEATVINKKTYIDYEEYEIDIKNNTNKKILLDTLERNNTIKLIASSGIQYGAYTNKLFLINLTLEPQEIETITIRFRKSIGSNNISKQIIFYSVIRDYDSYNQDKENYKDVTEFTIKLED